MNKRTQLLQVIGYSVREVCGTCAHAVWQQHATMGRCTEIDDVVSWDGHCPLYARALTSYERLGDDSVYAEDLIRKRVEAIVTLMNVGAWAGCDQLVAALSREVGPMNAEVVRLQSMLTQIRERDQHPTKPKAT